MVETIPIPEQNDEKQREIKTIEITNEYYNKCDEINYNINNFYQLFKELKDEDPLIQFKGLIGMKKLCLAEKKKEKPKKFFNVLINYLIIFIKEYSQIFQRESIICIKNIEKINLKVDEALKIDKNNDLNEIILNRIKNRKELKLEELTLEIYLSYINTILNDGDILKKFLYEKIIDEIINIINDSMKENNLVIIKKCLKIFKTLFLTKVDFNYESEFLGSLQAFAKNPRDILLIIRDIMNNYPNEIELIKYSLNVIEIFSRINYFNNLNLIRELNLLPKIIELTNSENGDIILFSMKIIGNFAMDNDSSYTQTLLDLNVIDVLKKTLKKEYDHISPNIRKEASLTVSNIAAGTQEQLIKLYDNNFYEILVDIIENEEEIPCKNNCLWAIYNFTCIKNNEYIKEIVKKGIIKIIIQRFNIDHDELLGCSLEALYNILQCEKNIRNPANINIIEKEIKDLDVLNAIKNLKETNFEEICQSKINQLLNTFFLNQNF